MAISHAVNKVDVAAISAVAYVFCDLLHELLGHGAATLLPLGVRALSVSTIGLTSTGSSPVVAAAGPAVNLAMSVTILFSQIHSAPSSWRYFFWVFGTINGFNATAYLLYSAILGTGDFAVAFAPFAPAFIWRPAAAIAGLGAYCVAIYASVIYLRRLIAGGLITPANADRYCRITYWTGGILLTSAAAFNPVSPWFILTSGAATGFGAMVGLLLIPAIFQRSAPATTSSLQSLSIGRGWLFGAAAVVIVFAAVFGPGLSLP